MTLSYDDKKQLATLQQIQQQAHGIVMEVGLAISRLRHRCDHDNKTYTAGLDDIYGRVWICKDCGATG